MERISEYAARYLAMRYETQIHALEDNGARLLGECAVRRMMEAMRVGCLDCMDNSVENKAIAMQLVDIIVQIDKRQGIVGLKHKTIPTLSSSSLKWHEQAIFKKPGIRTIDGECFHSPPETDVANFGYRLGTAEEAKALHYMRCRVKQPAVLESSVSFHRSSSFNTLRASQSMSTLTPTKSMSDLRVVTPPPPYKSPSQSVMSPLAFQTPGSPTAAASTTGAPNTEVEELRKVVAAQNVTITEMAKRLEQVEAMLLMLSAKVFPK